jgi:3-isopropylmalate/(R)-2-methylmalate dehydratase large subunit
VTPGPQTLAQKLVAKAAGRDAVSPGELVTVKVDLLFAHDSSGPRRWAPTLERLGAGVWDPGRVVVVSDHYVPAVDAASAEILACARAFARNRGLRHLDMQGICHAVLPERGLVRPGMFVAGGDSHTPTAGAFGAYAAGFGATDTTAILVTGETWTLAPHSILVRLTGELGQGVAAKDVMLTLCRDLGMSNDFRAVEYAGPAVDAMSMSERMVLSNMAAELGCEAGLIAPDATTLSYLSLAGAQITRDDLRWRSDEGARHERTHEVDCARLGPQVAAPHSPANTDGVSAAAGTRIDQAYIGACVGAKLEDLQMAAAVLSGRQVARGVRLLVAPATTRVTAEAAADGTLAALTEAGAILLPTGCGACAGLGAGLLAAGEVCISSTNRNFRGRMGSPYASVYLASPYTVAASAVLGEIADPRALLGKRRAAA